METTKKKYLGIITRDVVTATEQTNAHEIARLMKENDIGLVVITKDDKVTGIVSERDLARRVLADGLPLETTPASNFMTRDVVSIELKEGLNKMYQKLCEIKFRHLLVMDSNKLIGITSRRDLLDALSARGA